jgi:hypothetical protein
VYQSLPSNGANTLAALPPPVPRVGRHPPFSSPPWRLPFSSPVLELRHRTSSLLELPRRWNRCDLLIDDNRPCTELWMGAHPSTPSSLVPKRLPRHRPPRVDTASADVVLAGPPVPRCRYPVSSATAPLLPLPWAPLRGRIPSSLFCWVAVPPHRSPGAAILRQQLRRFLRATTVPSPISASSRTGPLPCRPPSPAGEIPAPLPNAGVAHPALVVWPPMRLAHIPNWPDQPPGHAARLDASPQTISARFPFSEFNFRINLETSKSIQKTFQNS